MKRYRTTKTWWDEYGCKYLPQEVLRDDEGFYIVDMDGENIDIFPKGLIDGQADWIEEIKEDEKEKKIEKVEVYNNDYYELVEKVNEIIDKLNSIE